MRKVILLLHNIRSVYNVGAILRTAEGLGVERVVFSGYTPRYNDENLLPHLRVKMNNQIKKSALGAEEIVPQEGIKPGLLTKWLRCATMEGYTLIGLENNLASDELPKRLNLGEKMKISDRVVLVLGEEVNGIPQDLREQMEYFLEIPMKGRKESFNVSVATGIALWGLLNCSE